MKKYFAIALLVIFNNVEACDVCGCSLGAFNMGILPNINSHYSGLRYQNAPFYAQINHGNDIEYSNDLYQRLDWISKIKLSDKIFLNVLIPFSYNQMKGNMHDKIILSGINDPLVLGYYQLISKEKNKMAQSLYVGGGLKLPLGKYNAQNNDVLINPNFQLGTGSIDFLSSLNYIVKWEKYGANMESSYKYNTTNKQDYRFGNQFNMSVNQFYIFNKNNFTLMPFVGLYFENAASHTQLEIRQFNTGGKILLGNIGIQTYINKLRIQGIFQPVFFQDFTTDNLTTIESKTRFSVDLIYHFGKGCN